MTSEIKSSSSIFSSSSNTSLRQKFASVFKSRNASKAQHKPSSLPKQDESDGVDRRFVTAFDSVKTGYIQPPTSRGICL